MPLSPATRARVAAMQQASAPLPAKTRPAKPPGPDPAATHARWAALVARYRPLVLERTRYSNHTLPGEGNHLSAGTARRVRSGVRPLCPVCGNPVSSRECGFYHD